jgi:hypothetical protein
MEHGGHEASFRQRTPISFLASFDVIESFLKTSGVDFNDISTTELARSGYLLRIHQTSPVMPKLTITSFANGNCLVQGPNPQATEVAAALRQQKLHSPARPRNNPVKNHNPTQPQHTATTSTARVYIQIYINTLVGHSTSIEVPADANIETLRNRIADIEGMCFDLVYKAKLIPPHGSLASIDLVDGASILHLIPTRAGAITRAQNNKPSFDSDHDLDPKPDHPSSLLADSSASDSEPDPSCSDDEDRGHPYATEEESKGDNYESVPRLIQARNPRTSAARRPINAVYHTHTRRNTPTQSHITKPSPATPLRRS